MARSTPSDENEPQRLFDLDASALGPFARDSAASRQAALDNYPRAGTQRHMIVAALRNAEESGHTREELSGETEIVLQAVCARVSELVERGWVQESGASRATRQKSPAGVLVLTDAARLELGADPRS